MYNATVKIVYRDSAKLVFRAYPDFARLKYIPGQYGALGLSQNVKRIDSQTGENGCGDALIKRPFSIASSILDDENNLLDPSMLEYYEFYANLILADESVKPRFSPRLFSLNDNDRIYIGPKIAGHHTLEAREPGKHVLLIATTTGEAPHNSMILELLRRRESCWVCSVVIGNEGWSSAYNRKHRELTKKFQNYRYLSLQDVAPYGKIESILQQCLNKGDYSEKTLGWAIGSQNTHVYLCGDPSMIGTPIKLGGWRYSYPEYGLTKLLTSHGFHLATRFQPGNLSYEAYW